jgi:hypothetical protein
MFPTFYLLLVLVVFPSEHIKGWDKASLHDQTDTMTFPMPSETACNEAAATVRATVQTVGKYPEGATIITRCHSVAAHQATS